uniref:Uncharacterized protein n=1 Tax=Hyaloperonospora arabidopsidis (strain Emoy2) TaxID=559515 RepID=M4BUF1_HYAAE
MTASLHRASVVNPPAAPITNDKREGAQVDPDRGAQNHPRRRGNLAEGVSRTPMSSPTPGTHATSPDIGIGHDDDVVSGVSPHGAGGSLAHRAASVEVGGPKEDHEMILFELSGLRETLGKTQSELDATQARVQALESGHPPGWRPSLTSWFGFSKRWQGQPPRCKRLQVHVGRIPIRLKQSNVEHRMCAQFAWKV